MNRISSGSLSLSKAIVGFVNFKLAEGLTDRSVDSYARILEKWLEYAGDKDVSRITSQDITTYLGWLRNEYIPRRFNGKTHSLSPKTLRNIYIGLSSFFAWVALEFTIPNPMKDVPPPRYKRKPVDTYTKEDLENILKACIYSREANPWNRRRFVMRRHTANRDRAIVLTLLDTGLRASELCALIIADVDLKSGRVEVKHGVQGGAKGGKGRTVYLGKTARKAVWRYLAERVDGEDPEAPLFVVRGDRCFRPDSLRHLIKSIGNKAGVSKAYPHKFRHTFAITYLRAGGDIFTLQALLGHSSLDMVRHYARIAQIDIERAHRKASPVDNWRL